MRNRITALLAALLVLLGSAVPIYARELPNPQLSGSLMLSMTFDGEALDGGSLTLYRVGDIAVSDGNAGFTLVEALSDGPALEDLDDPKLAKELAQLARGRNLPSIQEPIEMGWVNFAPLEPGLYVVTQQASQATEGFAAIQPFLISLPRWEDDTYVYDLTAAPKVPLVPKETEPTRPTEPTDPTEPTEPSPPPPKLPQTGQLNWPVPLLAVLGLTFFCLGWFLCFGGRKGHET